MKLPIILCAAVLSLGTANAVSNMCYCPPTRNVCGSDFKNYAGECNLKCASSLSGKNIYMIYDGPCEDLLNNNNPPIPPYDPNNPYNPYYPYPYNPYNNYPYYNPYNPYNPYDPYLFGSAGPKSKEGE
ncbi:uncharacterized protein LOC123703107 isoform X2 [Colias croceus]|uniref:uncharacterized protein LOC123703107 isoform X2 n=1 Tax=Colias crocea TaxID=72248 RepID=UPI001E27C28C|nr:uncharacterized protein LOC123703107 isoform X2 [Colias croceus]